MSLYLISSFVYFFHECHMDDVIIIVGTSITIMVLTLLILVYDKSKIFPDKIIGLLMAKYLRNNLCVKIINKLNSQWMWHVLY